MWANAIAAYLHYLSLGLIFAALSTELFTLKQDLTNRDGWRILIADTIYGIAGITILVTGILRYLYFEKGADYYSHQPVFWMKIWNPLTASVVQLIAGYSLPVKPTIPLRKEKNR